MKLTVSIFTYITMKLRERELRKLRNPSPEAVAIVKARDEELVKHRDAPSSIRNDAESELQKLRRPSPEAVAIVKARDEELTKHRDAPSSIRNDAESELQKLRRPFPEAVTIVKAHDEELAKHRDAPYGKSKEYGNSKGHYWKNQPLSPKRFN